MDDAKNVPSQNIRCLPDEVQKKSKMVSQIYEGIKWLLNDIAIFVII